jgi:hypothetical protein
LATVALALGTLCVGSALAQTWSLRQAVATAEADRLLAAIALPSGANSSATEPPGDRGRLVPPSGGGAVADLVQQGGWWIVPGTPLATLDYIHERSAVLADVGDWFPAMTEGGGEFATVRLQEGVGVIGERWLRLIAVALPDGSTGLRIDAQVLWLLPRDRIPRGARLLRVDVRRTRPGHPKLVMFNIRSVRHIARVTSLLNSLPIERPTLLGRLCPPPSGSLRLAFYRESSEPPLAVVVHRLRGCGGAQVIIRGKPQQPGLAIDLSRLEGVLGIKIMRIANELRSAI